MSPEPGATLQLAASVATARVPAEARLVAGDLENALARLVARREQRAGDRRIGAAFEAALERLDASREEALAYVGRTSVELALEIVRQLLRVELPAGRYDLERMVREALSFSGTGRGRCLVHVHPIDAAALSGVTFRAGTEIEEDAGVPRGSVHVTTPQGLLVRDLDEALRSIGERILGDMP